MSISSLRSKTYKHYPKPRLTALTLAQYCTEPNAKARAAIRQGARYMRVAGIVKNTQSRSAIQAYLGSFRRDREILDKAIAALQTRAESSFSTDFQKEAALRNIENLTRFVESEQGLGLGRYDFVAVESRKPDLILGGVPVSVQLDWFLNTAPAKDGTPQVGGAILQLAKGGPLPEAAKREDTRARRVAARADINRLMAAMVYQQLATNFAGNGKPARDRCIVIDPFVPDVYAVFGRLESQIAQLEEAAREIARQWNSITAPDDYDR